MFYSWQWRNAVAIFVSKNETSSCKCRKKGIYFCGVNIFTRIYNFFSPEKRAARLSAYDTGKSWLSSFWGWGGNTATSGVEVTSETAMRLPVVYACCKILSDSIASLPISMFRTDADGNAYEATERPEHALVAYDPSPCYTSFNWRSALQLHVGLRGNGYSHIIRDGRGIAKELRLLDPESTTPFIYDGKVYYETYGYAGELAVKRQVLSSDDVFHIPALGTDGVIGRAPISVLRDIIGIGMATQDFAGHTFNNKAAIGGILSTDSQLTAEQLELNKRSWREQYSGMKNAGSTPVLMGGFKFQPITLSPEDAQFVATSKLTTQQICGAYRIPLHMVGDLDRATFSNIEHQSLEFVQNTLRPWVRNWEQELNRKLVPYSLRGTHYFRFNMDAILRGDIKTRFEAYTRGIQWGIFNRDEVRRMENLNAIPGGLGQEYLTPLNMQVLGEPATEPGNNISDPGSEPQPNTSN